MNWPDIHFGLYILFSRFYFRDYETDNPPDLEIIYIRILNVGEMQTDWIKMLSGYNIIFLGIWNRKLNWLATNLVLFTFGFGLFLNSLFQVVSLPNS
jgi:hypothetical protein